MRRLFAALAFGPCVAAVAAAADLLPAGKVIRDCGDCPEVVVVPAGEFSMGMVGFEAEELPVRRVRIGRPFAIGRYEVAWGDDAAACRYANAANHSGRLKGGFLGDSFACEDGFDETAPTGVFEPNAFGLFDMLGNVWEWTDDCYYDNYVGAPADGKPRVTADCSRRVYRGGSWVSVPDLLRSSVRAMGDPNQHGPNVGFRVLRETR